MGLLLHQCGTADLDRLARISRTTFIHAFASQNNPEDFEHYLSTAFHPQQLLKELENPHSHFYFVFDGQALVGYFKLNEASAQTDIREADGLELERIYVVRGQQGKQIGKWMLQQVLDIGREKGKTYVWLGVWEENTGAIRFYEKAGFTKFGTHPYYIGKDRQTDWLMRLDLGTLDT